MPYVKSNCSGWESSARRLQKEASSLDFEKSLKYTASPNIDNVHEWICTLEGPPTSAYAGGTFFLELRFSPEYPIKPPSCNFLTRIYHMNVSEDGKVDIPILKSRWKATNTIVNILDAIYRTLEVPEVSQPTIPEICSLFKERKSQHDLIASQWCARFAT